MIGYVCVIAWLALQALTQPSSTGSISGRVVDADTGAPVVGARVGSRDVGWHPTGADGRYVLTQVPPGTATVGVQESNGGYTAFSLTPWRSVTVTAGRDTPGVDFRVRLDASVSGQVVDGNGEPLPGIKVVAVTREYSREGPYGGGEHANGDLWYFRVGSATTDDRGRYSIAGLFAGRPYRLLAFRPRGYAPPIADAPKDPRSRKTTLVPSYYPAASSFETAAPVVLQSLERREHVDIQMPRAASFCVETVLTRSGSPAAMKFSVEEEDLHRLESHATTSVPWSTSGTSGSDGRVRVCDLAPGTFRLSAADTLNPYYKPQYAATVAFAIDKQDVRIAPVSAEPLATIAGDVVWDDKPPAESYKLPSSAGTVPRVGDLTGPRASAKGEFAFDVVPGSRYSLWIGGLRPPLYVKDILHDGTSILRSSLVPGLATSGRLQIRVGHDGSSISARVHDRDGLPVARSWVLILSRSAKSEAELATAMWVGRADDTGLYTARGLPPDTYAVLASEDLPPAIVSNSDVKVEKTPETMAALLRARAGARLVKLQSSTNENVTVVPIAIR
jgi:protocatechuate 3,4-dioxygenase beta subunit